MYFCVSYMDSAKKSEFDELISVSSWWGRLARLSQVKCVMDALCDEVKGEEEVRGGGGILI